TAVAWMRVLVRTAAVAATCGISQNFAGLDTLAERFWRRGSPSSPAWVLNLRAIGLRSGLRVPDAIRAAERRWWWRVASGVSRRDRSVAGTFHPCAWHPLASGPGICRRRSG